MSTTSSSTTPRKPVTVERSIGGKTLSLESGKLAKQATGAVVVRLGDTMALVATVAAPGREGLDFFPMQVEYREKTYSAGKFPGGFIKREGRPSTKEILTSRLIDRPIRPLFPPQYRNEVQIQASPISADRVNDPDVLAMIGASASLIIAPEVPFLGPIGAVRLGRIDGKLIPLPTVDELNQSDLDLVVASTRNAVVMIEGFGQEIPEPEMLEAIMEAHRLNQDVIALQMELREGRACPRSNRSRRNPTRSFRPCTNVTRTIYARQRRRSSRPSGTRPSRSFRNGSSPRWSPKAPRGTRGCPRRCRSSPPSTRCRSGSSAR